MGADVIAWRGCPLQKRLGPDGFLGQLKLRSYQELVEAQVPEPQRNTVKLGVRTFRDGVPHDRQLTYAEVRAASDEFRRGIPECATCPLSGGRALGCYQFVSYPVDAQAEELLFAFFTQGLQTADSIADQLWRDIVSQVPTDSPWHQQRGPASFERSALALRSAPLEHRWSRGGAPQRVDSGQLLGALFFTQEQPALIAGYARFWREFGDYARAHTDAPTGTTAQLLALGDAYLRLLPLALQGQAAVFVDG